jgi:putative tryptophan/tyrosine transport system permease protein
MIEQILILFPLILGAYISFSLLKVPDLSLESAYVFGAAAAAQAAHFPFPLPFLAAMIGGALVGCLASLLNQGLKIPFLLAAVITNGFFHGAVQYVLGSSLLSLGGAKNPLLIFGVNELLPLALIGLALLLAVHLLLRSEMGGALSVYGNNPHFFGHHRISTRYVVVAGVVIADMLAGLSGYLFALSNGFVDLMMGFGLVLAAITSLILGKMLVASKKATPLIPLAGVCAYYGVQQALLSIGLNLTYFNAFQALFVLAALLFLMRKEKRGTKAFANHLGV